MPIEEITGQALGGIARFVGRILFESIFEFIIQGTGFILVRTVRSTTKPDDTACVVVGLLFWVAVSVGGYFVYRAIAA